MEGRAASLACYCAPAFWTPLSGKRCAGWKNFQVVSTLAAPVIAMMEVSK
jgi:hypothetical protein